MTTLADEARQASAQLLAEENIRLRRMVKELRAQLDLLHEQERKNAEVVDQFFTLLDEIPPCPQHGRRCMRFALVWVQTAAQVLSVFEALPRLREGEHP